MLIEILSAQCVSVPHTGSGNAAVCSSSDFALARTGEQQVVRLARFDRKVRAGLPPSPGAAPDRIVLGCGCKAALLHFGAADRTRVLTRLPGSPALAFAFRGADAPIADRRANRILLLSSTATAPTVLAAARDGIPAPASIWFDSWHPTILAGNTGHSDIALIPACGPPRFTLCGCSAALAPLRPDAFEAAPRGSTSPLLVLDSGVASPEVVFVASRE
jgi:hypothetical protein